MDVISDFVPAAMEKFHRKLLIEDAWNAPEGAEARLASRFNDAVACIGFRIDVPQTVEKIGAQDLAKAEKMFEIVKAQAAEQIRAYFVDVAAEAKIPFGQSERLN